MAIELGSTSYPYWAISQHYGIPYANVIKYLDRIPSAMLQRHEPWMRAVWEAWEKQGRTQGQQD